MELLQDAIVTAAAVGAAGVVARRVLGFVSVKGRSAGACDKCATSSGASLATRGEAKPADDVIVHPVVFIRPSRRQSHS